MRPSLAFLSSEYRIIISDTDRLVHGKELVKHAARPREGVSLNRHRPPALIRENDLDFIGCGTQRRIPRRSRPGTSARSGRWDRGLPIPGRRPACPAGACVRAPSDARRPLGAPCCRIRATTDEGCIWAPPLPSLLMAAHSSEGPERCFPRIWLGMLVAGIPAWIPVGTTHVRRAEAAQFRGAEPEGGCLEINRLSVCPRR